jgi:TonB family protein
VRGSLASPGELRADMDIPTEPVAGASGNREPGCPAEARRRGLQGRLLLRVNVSASGAPTAIAVAAGSNHPVLDEAALAAVRSRRFDPAMQAGIPLAAFADVPFQFRIEDRSGYRPH